MRRSPLVRAWLEHELRYGEKQREYVRLWLSYLSGDVIRPFEPARLAAPIHCGGPWRSRLIRDLGELLWDKVKVGNPHFLSPKVELSAAWRRRDVTRKDFRFLNARAFRTVDLSDAFRGAEGEDSFRHFFYQYVSSHDAATFDMELEKLFPEVLRQKDYKLATALLKNQKRLTMVPDEPVDLITLN